MIRLNKKAVILLTSSEVSAMRIQTFATNKILNIAPWATVSDKNVKCKQSGNRMIYEGENHTKVISSPAKR